MRLDRVPSSWYRGAYEDRKECVDSAHSFSLLHESAEKAALLVHGYAGYPGELESPAAMLHGMGYDVFVPRLPGMGTSGKDFMETSMDDWLTVVEHGILDLQGRYGHVVLVGHSMGCPLSLIASRGKRVDTIFLAAPAFSLAAKAPTVMLKALAVAGKVMDIPWHSDPSYRMHYEGAPRDDGYLGSEYWSHLYPKQMLELKKVMKEGKKVLEETDVPVMMAAGSLDAVCSYDEGFLSQHGDFNLILNGTHQLFYDPSPEVEEETLRLMAEFMA